jgi:dTDP-4-amino-4,6-dideoxygalactose transaminase
MAVPPDASPTFLPLARPSIGDLEVESVVEVLRSGWLTTGPRVRELERAFAEYVGAPHAVAVNSCTAALHLSLLAAGVGPGDEVITTPLTFCATANVILHTGATPVFADVDPHTGNLSPAAAAAAVTPRTRAVLPVHLGGRPADVPALQALAARHGLRLIEDAAHCIEGVSLAGKVGATGDATCFSFYATKNLTTGEGGMLTTASEEWARMARVAALHGMSRDAWARYAPDSSALYDVVVPGYKYNMMDIQAALGLAQLTRLDQLQARRSAVWNAYDAGLADLPLTHPAPCRPGEVHARHLYAVTVDPERCGWNRDDLAAALAAEGIGTSVHFRPVHLFTYYRERFGFTRGMLPHAERISDRTLSLPLSGSMTDADAARVVETMRRLLAHETARR